MWKFGQLSIDSCQTVLEWCKSQCLGIQYIRPDSLADNHRGEKAILDKSGAPVDYRAVGDSKFSRHLNGCELTDAMPAKVLQELSLLVIEKTQ